MGTRRKRKQQSLNQVRRLCKKRMRWRCLTWSLSDEDPVPESVGTTSPASNSSVQMVRDPLDPTRLIPLRSPAEEEQRRLGAERCERLHSSSPLYAAKAAADPEYWLKFWDSQPNF